MVLQVNGDNNYIYSKIGELVGDAQEEIDEIVWRVDSKIKEVKRNASSDKKSLKFEYDPMGNRIAKYVYDGEMLESSTFYVRDAQGTTIAVYDEKMITEVVNSTSITTVKYALAERYIYGSSRLGMDTTEVVVPQNEMVISPTSETTITRHLKKKLYELSNHLGNVLTVISDMKIPVGDPTTGVLEYNNPHIISVTDYSPFGVALSARTWSEQEYRFGFNGKDKESEFNSGAYDFGARIHDARLGRWLSVDFYSKLRPDMTPYRFAFSNPLRVVDTDGNYETDGHYYTVYLVCLMMGMDAICAEELARNTEVWDTKMGRYRADQNYTWAEAGLQQSIHALTGGSQLTAYLESSIMYLNGDGSIESDGQALHRFGDSFAHSRLADPSIMYGRDGYTTEHLTAIEPDGSLAGLRPDLIYERPELYLEYVYELANLISTKNGDCKIEGLDICKFEEMVQFATTNSCSLIGIINYEVAKFQGQNEFKVFQPQGAMPSIDAHLEQVENTEKYLKEQGVSYTKEDIVLRKEYSIFGFTFYSDTYLGVKFKILDDK